VYLTDRVAANGHAPRFGLDLLREVLGAKAHRSARSVVRRVGQRRH